MHTSSNLLVSSESASMALVAMVAVVAAALVCAAAESAPTTTGQTNCTTSCGHISVPYPFGMGPPHCYHPGFKLTCDTSRGGRPRLLLGNDGTFRVTHIFISNYTVRVVHAGAIRISWAGSDNDAGSRGHGAWPWTKTLDSQGPFVVAPELNELVASGCNVQATLHGAGSSIVSACSTSCNTDPLLPTAETGYGSGYCSDTIPQGRSAYEVRLSRLRRDGAPAAARRPVRAFIAEAGWIEDHHWDWKATNDLSTVEVPVVLQWAVWPSKSAQKKLAAEPGYRLTSHCLDNVAAFDVCRAEWNSSCIDTGRGYSCVCELGYHGNLYLPHGCQDVDECEHPEDHGCFGECTNRPGSHECRCRPGTHGDFNVPNGCRKYVPGLSIGIGACIVVGFLLLILILILMIQRFKHMRTIKLKQKFFKQNRGQLLEQLVSQRADIAERMIVTLDELAKATNNFDKARELGGGGHGTVYKGILSDLHVVAIKKSNITVQKEIDEFINEVAILSQINHRNIVKLFGCCLEAEVPLLVYEFISNGTLYNHLHVEGPISLPWSIRLRIAKQTASALSYLHSLASTPIVHRDIKSSNILLDDTLTTKVSDFGASRYIPIDKTGLTTRVQGTIGYLDPMYFYTGRLTDKSDVYSFGVILVELLTRKKPFSYLSKEGDGLVAQFVNVFTDGNLDQILDLQVMEEGDKEVQEVAALAASCIKLSGENRPTMRQVELTLKGLQAGKDESEGNGKAMMNFQMMKEAESSRRYSLEQEMLMSATYPR
ncbi:unnamed protein product [Urochloa humidicola]